MQRERKIKKIHEIHIRDHKDKVCDLSLRLWPPVFYIVGAIPPITWRTDSLIFAPIHLFPSAANSVNISKHLGNSAWLASRKWILISSSWYCYPETTIGLGPCTFRIMPAFTFGGLGSVLWRVLYLCIFPWYVYTFKSGLGKNTFTKS